MGRAPLEVGRSAVLVGPAAMAVVVAPRLLLGRALAVAARAEAIKRVRQRHQRADADQGDPGPLRRALAHDDEQNADERQGEREAVADEPQQLRRQRGGGGAGPGAARVRAVTDEDARRTAEANRSVSGISPGTKPRSGSTSTAARVGSTHSASTITPLGATGPPTYTRSWVSASHSRSGTASLTVAVEGRLRTSPIAPSSVCSAISTTVRRKLGSSRVGPARRSLPRCESIRRLWRPAPALGPRPSREVGSRGPSEVPPLRAGVSRRKPGRAPAVCPSGARPAPGRRTAASRPRADRPRSPARRP